MYHCRAAVPIIILILCCVRSITADTPVIDSARAWFEWGEYGKITGLSPDIDADTSLADSTRALLYLYSGVAAFSFGQIGAARGLFWKAFQIDSALVVDNRYVTRGMVDLFETTRHEYLQELSEKIMQDSMTLAKLREEEQNRILLHHQQEVGVARRQVRRNALAQVAGFLFMFGGIAGADAAYQSTQSTYLDFTDAAAAGDLARYNQSRSLIIKGDVLTAVSGFISFAGGTTGIVFLFKTIKSSRRLRSLQKSERPEE
jgi:hypothetical protein